ncbi:brefeldin A-inhibited guanine nucleotide-exchange protein 3-like, partial [Mercenaria mercenaria]|uniref:brefeldin A-inhibited guanine nucleotide-exchange protein 3-like n=1 Tax=Mercenaria mercenaria TaxID=6596 RepID=UPI00234F6F6E
MASLLEVSSSEKCYTEESSTVTVLNADSIYSTSYSALSLGLNLTVNGYYDNRDKSLIPISERQFIDSVLDTDMFLYLSPDWLSTVYKCVLDRDLLGEAGWNHEEDTALITALKDIDGEGSHAIGGQMMRGSVLCEEDTGTPASDSELVKAGKLLASEILSTCWDGILDVLSVLLNGKSAIGVTNTFAIMIGTEGAKEESLRKREALCKCLDGLQTAAKLCCSLGLQERCEGVFALLANTSCVMEDFKHATFSPPDRATQKSSILLQSKPKLVRLHAAHVLSMDAMMTTGLEIGSHSADCWKQVFRCCAFISELEHTYFSSGNNQSSLPRIQQEHAVGMATQEE